MSDSRSACQPCLVSSLVGTDPAACLIIVVSVSPHMQNRCFIVKCHWGKITECVVTLLPLLSIALDGSQSEESITLFENCVDRHLLVSYMYLVIYCSWTEAQHGVIVLSCSFGPAQSLGPDGQLHSYSSALACWQDPRGRVRAFPPSATTTALSVGAQLLDRGIAHLTTWRIKWV